MPLQVKRPFINKRLMVLATTHFLNDIYGSFLPTFIPLIVSRLGITYAQAGLLKSLSGVIHMVVQPMAGYVSDLFSRPYAIIIGPVMTALGASLLPLAPTYGTALILVGLWGFGSAIYHPLGHGSVGYVGDPGKLAFYLAVFAVGGMLGSTLSPLYAIFLAQTFGFGPLLPVAALVPVVAGALLVARFVPTLKAEGSVEIPSARGFFHSFGSTFKVILPVWMVCVCRDTSVEGIRFFLPLLVASRGGSIVDVGTILFLISTIGTISPMLLGPIADRFGRGKVIVIGMILSPLFLVPASLITGAASIALYMAGNAILLGLMPVTGAVAQEMAPGSRSTAASMVTGLSFGLAGLLTAPIGALADSFGLKAILLCLGLLPLLPVPVFMTMWREKKEA